MSHFKHLTLSERFFIERSLNESWSFKAIGRELGKDCTSITKEISNHKIFKKTGCLGKAFNDCYLKRDCVNTKLCDNPQCSQKYCRSCVYCSNLCPDYQKETCPSLSIVPYV